ncbi:MAG: excinuclease ABC subunit UvrA [Clostridia bacterium]|nr:excinuclease ABC subunit UvrA [Clostridia bacterium]
MFVREVVMKELFVKGARQHNLKNIDISIPRESLVVFTGLSGSGKTSLAFDTIYAEGQRRYVESLSSYARQFLGQMEKPDVDYIEGLSPAISIDQKTTARNPRSTVGTVTEIYDYLRLLYARIGIPHCPKCGKEIRQQSIDQMVDAVLALPERSRIYIYAPIIRGKKGENVKLLEDLRKSGFARIRLDGTVYELGEDIRMDKNKRHTLEVVVDRLIVRADINRRLTDSMETALRMSGGIVTVAVEGGEEMLFSQNYACDDCGISIEELEPRLFSFNSPFGACPACSGLGTKMTISRESVVPDDNLPLSKGAINASGWNVKDKDSFANMYFRAIAEKYGFTMDTPFKDIPEEGKNVLLYGTGGEKLKITYDKANGSGSFTAAFEGIIPNLERKYEETGSEYMRGEYENYMTTMPCPQCGGKRLKKEALAVTVGGKSIVDVCDMSISDSLEFFKNLELDKTRAMIAERILKEICTRLSFLCDVGLSYLTMMRGAATLSGGEAQRIRLATQIGSGLMGVLYILDEPSIGLHQRDNSKLLATLKHLRDLGNTLIVVEHDEDTMREADYLVDIGPGAGIHGGKVVAQGTPMEVAACKDSITGKYLSGELKISVPKVRRTPAGWLRVKNAGANNLKNIDVDFPLGVFTCVTGVSGSGKSSLVNEILYKALARDLNRAHTVPGKHGGMEGVDKLDKIIAIDQSPIGRTPRSNPATYTGLFDMIRTIFAQTNEAKARGYKANRFSFNVKGGRCEACSGDGIVKIEMHFLPDIYVPCEVCHGQRYNRETLEVRYKGKNIYEVLDMTIEEALGFFENHPKLRRILQTLNDVGLGYVKLGQPSTQLSGGEAQRVKLATELSRKSTGRTLYLLDEPTTGLHTHDVAKLIDILNQLAEGGNTVVVIEHNLDVIKTADYIIDMGPEGGNMGGTVVACGTPEQVALCPQSYTGAYIKDKLG